MSDTEIPDDVKQQALDAGTAAREAMNTPTDGEPVDMPTPDAPEDSTNMPDPYDSQGVAEQQAAGREAAIADRDAPSEPVETEASGSISDLSQADMDAALSAGQTINDAMDSQEINAEPSVSEETVNTPVGDLSQEDYDAALQAGQTINDAMDAQTVQESDPDAAPDEAAPDQDTSLDLTPEPDTPEPDGPDPE
jgi:hypothetical protein